jgi:transposase
MGIGAPKSITECRRFFLEPQQSKQRMYEALRAYFVDGRPSHEVARDFGYTPGSFRVLCHQFRRDAEPEFFIETRPGPRSQPKKSSAKARIIALRKQNWSVYEISETLKEEGKRLSPTAVREVLREEGFAPLPRRLDEERPAALRPTAEPIADVRHFDLSPRHFETQCGGLFLFIPDLVRLDIDRLAKAARLPGSRMIPAAHALRASLVLKLWSLERKSHIMSLVADEGLGLFAGLNVIPKKSFLSEYSSRIDATKTTKLLAAWHRQVDDDHLFEGDSFDLDFHSVPYQGEHPVIERHYSSKRSRRQPSVLVFVAEDADTRAFCYASANIRKGEESDQVLQFVEFWKRQHGRQPRQLVFDSKLTTQDKMVRLDDLGIDFITLRRRSPHMLKEVAELPPSAWRRVNLNVPTRKYRTPRVYEQTVTIKKRDFRQLYILDLGHDAPTVLLTNQRTTTASKLVGRYAQRMLVENALADAVRFFHMDALSSAVALKVDFDMALLVVASGLYRLTARRMRGYSDARARQIFRDLIDMPATITVSDDSIHVRFHRRAHLPIVMASGLLETPVAVPWWGGRQLVMSV